MFDAIPGGQVLHRARPHWVAANNLQMRNSGRKESCRSVKASGTWTPD